jgi:hypothetical protein
MSTRAREHQIAPGLATHWLTVQERRPCFFLRSVAGDGSIPSFADLAFSAVLRLVEFANSGDLAFVDESAKEVPTL